MIYKLILVSILLSSLAMASNDVNDSKESHSASSVQGYVNSSSSKIYYKIRGNGNPLILLHGGLGPANHFQGLIPEFEKLFKLILVHTRGHGRSTDDTTSFSYSSFAYDLNNLMEHLQIDSVNILGFSDGGVTGYHFASKYPSKVMKLIAVGANYRVGGLTEGTIGWIESNLNPEYISNNLTNVKDNFLKLNPNPENFDGFINKTRMLWLNDPYISKNDIQKISNPVLLVAGDNDAIRLDHMLEIHQLIKNSQLCILPNASHNILNEKVDLINRICLDFLNVK